MPHRFHATAALAFVEPSASRVVVPGVHYSDVFGAHHALLAISVVRRYESLFLKEDLLKVALFPK